MPFTTQVKNIAELLDLSAYAGDFVGDFDMGAVHADFLAQLNADVFDGVTVCANGDVIAELPLVGAAHEIDWKELADGIDVEPIFERHDRTAQAADDAAVEDAAAAERRTELLHESPALYDPAYAAELDHDRELEN